ncbi:MAG: hypothetical protein J6X55_07795 [Victivallales bacterium]|nr:hypothetical protein [Victivallales bacterium]
MKLLVTGAWQATPEQLQQLHVMGHEVILQPQESEPLGFSCENVEGTICNDLFLVHPIEKFTHLRYIQLTSAGFDRVPMDYVAKQKIEIHNARGVYSAPMAEFAIAGVLQLYKQAEFFRENQRRHHWQKNREIKELSNKTVLVIGCGSVGTECAKRFQAFGCKVFGVDLIPRFDNHFQTIRDLTELDNFVQVADIVVLTLPLTDETRGLFNRQRIAQLKADAVLVNIARGAVIDQAALVQHLDRLGGAVLDVFEEEPLPKDSPLWDASNVILTPHNSFVGDGNFQRLSNLILRNLESCSK